MKKLILVLVAFMLVTLPAGSVLKEKNLARTLGVLRAELEMNYRQQQMLMQRWEQQGAQQHEELVGYMTQCEQIGLMLYSQNQDNTFDMAYACQHATDLYHRLNDRNGKMLPYDKIILRLKRELERLDALIASLKAMPPVEEEHKEELTEVDSLLLSVIDSLGEAVVAHDSVSMHTSHNNAREENASDISKEPLYLTGQQLEDRAECLKYAEIIRENMHRFMETLENESIYYASVQEKVSNLNKFAKRRYLMLQDNIFRNGSDNYFKVLSGLPRYMMQAKMSYTNKYRPFEGKDVSYSEWRGAPVLFVSLFLIIYLGGAWLLTYGILRLLVPKRWRGKNYKLKLHMLTNVIGIAVFGIAVMIVRSTIDRGIIQMGTEMMINTAWLLEAIFLSLYVRLKGEQMLHAAKIYTPLIVLAFCVIMFRIVLLPNPIINIVFPPVLLALCIWQTIVSSRHRKYLPMLDMVYSLLTTVMMVTTTIMTWTGFSLMSVQVILWWMFQLAAIMTITCIHVLLKKYEEGHFMLRLSPELKEHIKQGLDVTREKAIIKTNMAKGKYISQTWLYDLANFCLVPILACISVLWSFYWAAATFNMTAICRNIFTHNFVDVDGLIQISIFKLCIVTALFFIFRWTNYTLRSAYIHFRLKTTDDEDSINFTLARNLIAILSWGLFVIISLVVLKVPRSGISVITAGLATGMGFAMKDLLENFFYGISLMTGRVRVGDYIECDGITGRVERITYQSTMIDTLDGCVIAILNSALFTKNFKNLTQTDDYQLVKISVGVSYGTNIDDVRSAVISAMTEDSARNLDQFGNKRNEDDAPLLDPCKKVTVRFAGFGDSSVNLYVCAWSRVQESGWLKPHWEEVVYNALNRAGIEIPFPQRDLNIKTMPK